MRIHNNDSKVLALVALLTCVACGDNSSATSDSSTSTGAASDTSTSSSTTEPETTSDEDGTTAAPQASPACIEACQTLTGCGWYESEKLCSDDCILSQDGKSIECNDAHDSYLECVSLSSCADLEPTARPADCTGKWFTYLETCDSIELENCMVTKSASEPNACEYELNCSSPQTKRVLSCSDESCACDNNAPVCEVGGVCGDDVPLSFWLFEICCD